jgi:hypothetical protein
VGASSSRASRRRACGKLRDDRLVEVILNLPGAADLGYDVTRKRLLVPLTASNKVEVYEVP